MIKQIILYIFKREAYNSYVGIKNSTIDHQISILNKTFMFLLISLWVIICLFLGYKIGAFQSIFIFIMPISLWKCISSVFMLTKRKVPIYTQTAIFKSDRRFKDGRRLSHYEPVLTGYRELDSEELNQIKQIAKTKLYIWTLVLVISIISICFFIKAE